MSSTKIGVGIDAAAGREFRAVKVAAMSRHGSIRFGTDSSRIPSGIRLPQEGDLLQWAHQQFGATLPSDRRQVIASPVRARLSHPRNKRLQPRRLTSERRRAACIIEQNCGHARGSGPWVSPTSWNPDLFRVARVGIGCCASRDQSGVGPEPVVPLGNVAGVDVFVAQL